MRHIFGRALILCCAIPLLGLALNGCSNGSNVNVLGDTGERTILTVKTINAKTGAPIDDVDLTISLNSNAFTNTSDTTENGISEFVVKSGITTEDGYFTVAISAEANNYLATSATTSFNESSTIEISLMSIDNPIDGTGILAPFSFNTSNIGTIPSVTTTTDYETSVTIPSGTVMKDIEGNTVNGDLRIVIAQYDGSSPKALKSIPTGGVLGAVNNLPSPTASYYVTGSSTQTVIAATTIKIVDSQDNEVKTFENGEVTINLEIPDTMLNPETGNAFLPGESIDIVSLDETSGLYRYEQSVLIADLASGDGKLNVSYDVNHLTVYISFKGFVLALPDKNYDTIKNAFSSGKLSNVKIQFNSIEVNGTSFSSINLSDIQLSDIQDELNKLPNYKTGQTITTTTGALVTGSN